MIHAGQDAALAHDQPDGDLRFDGMVALLSSWMVGGVHLDAWAHHRVPLETFFTPWHGVLYSGFLALAALLVGKLVLNVQNGHPASHAVPAGYGLSVLGVLVFFAGGVADMLWHTLLGIELSIEALLSPPHLLLAFGGALIITGPIRAAWRRAERNPGLIALLPALLSLALLLAHLTFFVAYASPLSEAVLARGARPATEDFYALYFATLAFGQGMWWRIHLWAGAIVLAGIAGWLLSYLLAPPEQPERMVVQP